MSISAFFVVPREHPLMTKSTNKIGVIRGAWTDAVSKGGMSGTDAGKTGVGKGVVTGPRKWEFRS